MAKGVHTVELVEGKKRSTLNIEISDDGFSLGLFKKKFTPWTEVNGIEIEGPGNVGSRITATRLVTLGVFALAAKKKSGETFVMITLKSGQVISMMFKKMNSGEIKSLFAPIMKFISAEENRALNELSASEQIKELASLMEQGLLTQEEFDAAKKQILGI